MPNKQINSNRKFSLMLAIKGAAMGIADVIPGVSGGTIALLLGIYQQFIESLSEINMSWLKLFLQFKWKDLWQKDALRFLINLALGLITAILLGAKVVSWGLHSFPEIVWTIFFGLVLGSIFILLSRESKLVKSWMLFLVGATIAWGITQSTVLNLGGSQAALLLSGALAICAMLLPGISGSYVLLILGQYERVINALKSPFIAESLTTIAIFSCGALLGLLLASRLIKWLLINYRHSTIMLLIGFMAGALPKLWPWKEQGHYLGSSYDFIVIAVGILSLFSILFADFMVNKNKSS